MLELIPTPLLGATLILLLSIFAWWLIVERVFNAPSAKRSKSKHHNGSPQTSSSQPETSKLNGSTGSGQTAQAIDAPVMASQAGGVASPASSKEIKTAVTGSAVSALATTHAQHAVKSSRETNQQTPQANKNVPATTPKYQTAAKAKRPAAGSEASLQIPVATTTSAATSTTGNVHSISVAANSAEKQKNKSKPKNETHAPIAFKPPQENTAEGRQTPIEKVMEQQSLARTPITDRDTSQSEVEKKVDEDATLRAKLAASEQRIKTLQSTLNNLQNTLPVMTTPLTAIPQHSRPSLSSKVRVLDSPKA